MSKKEIRVSDLTLDEFRGELLSILRDFDLVKQPCPMDQKSDQDIIFIDEAMKLVHLSKGTIYNKVNKGEMPCLCGGTPLTFSKKDLIAWIENGKPSTGEMIANKLLTKKSK